MDPLFIERVLAPAFVLMGLSHVAHPQLWVRFFEAMRQTGFAGLIIPLYTLPVGLVLIAGHNLWVRDWPLFLTIAGWGMTAKSALYLLVPGLANRMLARRIARSDRGFRAIGLIALFFGAILTWQSWTR